MKLEQAARQALDALEELFHSNSTKIAVEKYNMAHSALREALAEQEEQEPAEKSYYIEGVEHGFAKGVERCAKLIESGEFGIGHMMSMHDDESVAQALRELYAAPVRTKDLTDDEINELWLTHGQGQMMYIHEKFARAVIAADREKNNV